MSTNTYAIEFSGQLHNIPELLSKLNLESRQEEDLIALLKTGWQRWGTGLAEQLVGDYALALTDKSAGLTYLVRHPLGIKPLYYRVEQGELSYAFTIPELQRRCPKPLTKDMDWAASYMLHMSFSQTETAYKEIKKVPPGHWLTCDHAGNMVIQHYHQWQDDAPHAIKRDEKWVDAYREVLEESIRCRIDSDAPMGTENSGGIDSATISAYLAHFLGVPGDRLYSFGFALCEQEPAFILETSQARRIRHNYIISDRYGLEDGNDPVADGLALLGYPEEHGNAGAHTPFYRECQQRGIHTLFSGFGGDEVVTNPGHHLRYELLDGRHYPALWDILPGDPLRRTLRLLKTSVVARKNPSHRPAFLQAWNQRWPHQLLRLEVVQRLDLYERYMETAIYDAPYRRINDFILQHHLKKMQLTARLENCTVMAAAYGVDYRWPLWDVRLVQQYLSTPSIEKVGPKGMGRYLHRRAIDGVVPKRVAWKPSKDMGYGQLHQKMQESGVIQIAKDARELEANLEPALAELIDLEKLRTQIARAEQGHVSQEFAFFFRRGIRAMQWLDGWLKG